MNDSVDTATEARIETIIRDKLRGTTVIAVNHRLESALEYDMIIVMKDGQVSEIGTPREMVERCDLFAGLSLPEGGR